MKVLVIGSGGREHALVWKLAQSSYLSQLYCAPGNAGSCQLAEAVPIAADDIPGLCDFAREQRIDLTVVGPEVPLALGLTDAFTAHDLCVFGPTRAAAQLEWSKAFAKDFMRQEGIPTAASVTCDTYQEAVDHIRRHRGPLVVKADGLAAGKGVTVCQTPEQALQAVQQTMQEQVFGEAGRRVVLEEYLEGEEISVHALVDGEQVVPLPSSQDYKRAYDHDQGPNTGGMGASSPAPIMTDALHQHIMTDIVMPTVQGMAARGMPYRGVLYTGLMIVAEQPYVIEFNARFGDPETQPLLVRLADDLLPLLDATARGRLTGLRAEVVPEPAVCVVMASGGYPGPYTTGLPVTGLDGAAQTAKTWLFHAGTEIRNGCIVTSGGRVLGVTARAATIASAIKQAYDTVERIQWPGVHYRRDIGHRALQRASS